ncbi:MAG TPA: hypothetical protein VER96_10890 [Polyangiaceae bacterium]|nr:hypothetical protein [Polyangiaceae bacterium]
MVRFSWVLVGLALCLSLTFDVGRALAKPGYAAAPGASGNFGWQRQTIAELPRDSNGETTFFIDKLICNQSYRNVHVRCWDVSSGALQFDYEVPAPGSGKSVESAGYAQVSNGLLLAYHVGTDLWLREIDSTRGKERRAVTFKLDDDSSAHVGNFKLSGGAILYSLRKKLGKSYASLFRSADAQSGKIAYELNVDFSLDSWDLATDVVYFGSNGSKGTAVHGYDSKSGKQLFSRPFGQEFLHGIAAGPQQVFVEFDNKLLSLDARTGQPKGSVAVEKQGNKGPRVFGDRVYVCASGLASFSLALAPVARIALPNEWIIDCDVRDGYATLHDNHTFHLLDLRSNSLIATNQIREDKNVRAIGIFDGNALPVPAAAITICPTARSVRSRMAAGASRSTASRGCSRARCARVVMIGTCRPRKSKPTLA